MKAKLSWTMYPCFKNAENEGFGKELFKVLPQKPVSRMKAGFNLFIYSEIGLKVLEDMAHNCQGRKKELLIENSFEVL